jgi:thiamine kinase-like enzyme
MSGDCQREMTLDEWVERLPEIHRARKEYAALKAEVEKFTSTNNARDEIAALADELDDFNSRCVAPYGRITEIVAKMRQLSPVA